MNTVNRIADLTNKHATNRRSMTLNHECRQSRRVFTLANMSLTTQITFWSLVLLIGMNS